MVTMDDFNVGQYVKSKAGRDKGRIFLVLEIIDQNYVLIADGDLRRLEKPKRKKIKHLLPLDIDYSEILGKIDSGKKMTNLMIRREIEKIGLD